MVELEGLTKRFGRVVALDDVCVRVEGGVTGLLGPNGAGKSTLIKILLGLLRATSGRGQVLDFDVAKQSRQIRAKVGYMPEDDCYLPALSGVECVQFAARLCRMQAVEALRRAHEILDFCDMGQERYRAVETYSTGMRQKLKFASALVHDPPLLILDEPTAGLDPEERIAMLRRIGVLAQRSGKSVILCTHILPDVQSVCEHVVIMARGRVCVADRLERLSERRAPAVHLRTVGAPEPFCQQLEAQGLSVDVGHTGMLTVEGGGEQTADTVWAAAHASGTVLRSMQPARNSMEAIFLEAVREAGNADS